MSDTSEHPAEYKPEDGAEVRPAPRYTVAPIAPGGLEALAHDTSETPYRSLSLLAIAALALAVAYSFVIALGGVIAFWDRAAWVLIVGTVLVPLLSLPVALKFDIRERGGLLRIAGLSLALFYAVPVGFGGLIAFPSHAPWLLPLWTLLFPLLAAGCGWAARLHIQASEETLSGKQLAMWAIGLSLFFASCYTAFYLATFFAIRQQAVQFADDWIDKLQKGDVERAFVLTVPPTERGTGDSLSRETLELNRNDIRAEDSPLSYSGFNHRQFVLMLRGSTKANVELVAVRDWGFEKGGYKVQLGYKITTPYWSFPLDLAVHGVESQKDEYKGRRWFVNADASGSPRNEITVTALGIKLVALQDSGHRYARKWLNTLWNDENLARYETLSAEERAEDLQIRAIAAATGPGVRASQTKRTAFLQGALLNSDEKLFWAPTRARKAIVDEMQSIFAVGDKRPTMALRDLKQPAWPTVTEEDGRLRFRFHGDSALSVPIEVQTADGPITESTKFHVEWRLVVSCPAAALQGGGAEWRVDSLELIRARREEKAGPSGSAKKR